MRTFRIVALLIFVSAIFLNRPQHSVSKPNSKSVAPIGLPSMEASPSAVKGALLATRFLTLEELKQVVSIDYFIVYENSGFSTKKKPFVRITHKSSGREVTSILESDISEYDFIRARDGGFWDKLGLALHIPFAVISRKDLQRAYFLSRRIYSKFGVDDVAFYDFAETMFCHINPEDLAQMPAEDLTEKGFINTFNHITGQVFTTSIFSERLADLIADAHEYYRLPALATGDFTEIQLADLENGPIDNYVDLINNEWGQELGKELGQKYNISKETHWTPELMTNYLNDVQQYYSWAFQIGFQPYKVTDEVVIIFANKINGLMKGLPD